MSAGDVEPPIPIERAQGVCDDILRAISGTVIATDAFLQRVLTGVLAQGHVLLEDVPGTGKTLTARAFAGALGLEFNRIQFTPDLLPSDITGSSIYMEQSGEFRFNQGPIFANIVLADEINRAPPKTQAALLEAMEEKQVSAGGATRELPAPFFVIATQNPVEQEGTFMLPESQRDRFMIKTAIGYPDRPNEQELLDRRTDRIGSTPAIEQVTDTEAFRTVQKCVEYIHVAPDVRDYIIDLGRATREHEQAEVGVSPRGVQQHLEAARARAVINGREYVVPGDVKSLAQPALAHRLVLTSTATVEGTTREAIIEDVLQQIEVPAMDAV